MESRFITKILPLLIKSKGAVSIIVKGHSMFPLLKDGDNVTICISNEYYVGDILLFVYKNDELLLHRLVNKSNRYYCKGDNAFRLEDINKDQIIGKLTHVNGAKIEKWASWKTALSFKISRIFFRNRYDLQKTKNTYIYRFYEHIILNNSKDIIYKKNTNVDFIQSERDVLTVFNPARNETFIIDDIGTSIINIVSDGCTIDGIVNRIGTL